MTKNMIPVIGIAIMLVVGLMVGVGYAMDASDGSIDALDDDKWAATGGDGVREARPAATSTTVSSTLEAKRSAYDFGIKVYESDPTVCSTMLQIHNQAETYLDNQIDPTGYLTEARDLANDWVTDAAKESGHSSQSRFAVSGFWDELARDCPQALFEIDIAGRP